MSLSRKSLVIFSLIILLAITGIWLAEPLQGIWKLPAILMLLLMVWERFQLNQTFSIERKISASVSLGEPVVFTQSVKNLSLQTLCFESQAHYPDSIQGEALLERWIVDAGKTQTREINVIPISLGSIALGQIYGRILGSFGLVWWTHNFKDETVVKVEPAVLTHNQVLSGQVRTGGQKTRYKASSGFELLELRDYQYGDSQRNIDWKASARRQKPMVRVFSQEQRLEIVILVDCGRGSYIQCGLMDRLHHYINVASRLAGFAIQHDDYIACIAYAEQVIGNVPMAGGITAVKKIRNLLAGLSTVADESNPLMLALELKRFLKRRSLVIFLTEIEQAEASTQLIQAMQLLRSKHHILVASINDLEVNELIYQPEQHWLAPYQKLAALEYMRGRELTINKLRKSGISVIASPADKLDSEVLSYYQQLHHSREV